MRQEKKFDFSAKRNELEGPLDTIGKLNPSAKRMIYRTVERALGDPTNLARIAQKINRIYGIPNNEASLRVVRDFLLQEVGNSELEPNTGEDNDKISIRRSGTRHSKIDSLNTATKLLGRRPDRSKQKSSYR